MSNAQHLKHIKIEGFKSIAKLDLPMESINVLIGANGAGKSNFVSAFTLLSHLSKGKLQNYIETEGGAEPLRDKVIPSAIENNIGQKGLSAWATNVLAEFGGNPEQINNSAQTAPSKRLLAKSSYAKTIHGPNIAVEIGLDGLREKCLGFNDWLNRLENL